MKKNRIIALGLVGVMCMSSLFGCTKKDTANGSDVKAEVKEEVKTIGTKAEGENVFAVVMNNKTGKTITALSVKDSSVEAYPENMMTAGDVFKDSEKRELFYDATAAKAAAEAAASQAEAQTPILDPQYNIQLTFEDGTILILNAFPFGDLDTCDICLADGVAYIDYTSTSAKQKVSTKEAELSIIAAEAAAQAQAEAEAAAQAQAEAEAAAAEAAAAQEEESYSYSNNYSDNSSNYDSGDSNNSSSSNSDYSEPSSSGGDGCLDNGLFY